MDERTLQRVNRRVYAKFPDLAGVQPKVQPVTLPDGEMRIVLIYRRTVRTADGRALPRLVRVIWQRGRILKMTTSR